MTGRSRHDELRALAEAVAESDECLECHEYGNQHMETLASGVVALLDEVAAAEARVAERDGERNAVFDDDWQFRLVCRQRDAERARADKATRDLEFARRHIERAERAEAALRQISSVSRDFTAVDIAVAALHDAGYADLDRSVSESATKDGAAG